MSDPCHYCGKVVYHAEMQKHETGVYHAKCFTKYSKDLQQQQKMQQWGSNLKYDNSADVQPAYYRAATDTGKVGMQTGSEYRGESGKKNVGANHQSPSSGSGTPKFCPECGAKVAAAKFCGECGFKF